MVNSVNGSAAPAPLYRPSIATEQPFRVPAAEAPRAAPNPPTQSVTANQARFSSTQYNTLSQYYKNLPNTPESIPEYLNFFLRNGNALTINGQNPFFDVNPGLRVIFPGPSHRLPYPDLNKIDLLQTEGGQGVVAVIRTVSIGPDGAATILGPNTAESGNPLYPTGGSQIGDEDYEFLKQITVHAANRAANLASVPSYAPAGANPYRGF